MMLNMSSCSLGRGDPFKKDRVLVVPFTNVFLVAVRVFILNPLHPKSDLDFTLSNARRFYLTK